MPIRPTGPQLTIARICFPSSFEAGADAPMRLAMGGCGAA